MNLLIPRYPGSKRLYNFDDSGSYDAVIEPFAGSAITSLKLLNRGVRSFFWADADSTVRAVYQVWVDEKLRDRFHSCLEEFRSAFFIELSCQRFTDAQQDIAWNQLKEIFQGADESDPAKLAAASLCLRKLTFGGVVRESPKSKKLNVTYCQDQLPVLKRWKYEFPIAPSNLNLSVSSDWRGAFEELEKSGRDRAFCLIDPPYWLPLSDGNELSKKRRQIGLMSPCYLGHKPHDRATLDMCVDAIRLALQSEKIQRIVITNYMSDELHGAIVDLCEEFNKPLNTEMVGKLDGINRSRVATTQNREAVWSIGDPSTKQLNLLQELLAL